MREQIIGILPFVSFEEKIIRLDNFLIFSESRIQEIGELSESVQEALRGFTQNQRAFVQNSYGNRASEITFLLPTAPQATRQQLERCLEIVFFYLHKGASLTHLLSTPNVFCREDFRLFTLGLPDADCSGSFIAKRKFKFHIVDRIDRYVVSPVGCENVVTQNHRHGYIFRDIGFNHKDEVFQLLMRGLDDSRQRNLLQAVSFYNRAMSCDLTDAERFVWLSSSLESFLQIGSQHDKAAAIREKVADLLRTKQFTVIDKEKAIVDVADLIRVVYDYRSSYVHDGKTATTHPNLETMLTQKLGALDVVVALMNLVSFLLVHERIPDNKLEGMLYALFHNQECFDRVIGIYKESAAKAIGELDDPMNVLALYEFLRLVHLPTVSFDRQRTEKCLDNILRVLARFARENPGLGLAQEVQHQIEAVALSDQERFKKWSDFLDKSDLPSAPEPVYVSVLVFRDLVQLLQYEHALY